MISPQADLEFRYSAADRDGVRSRGVMRAAHREDAIARLSHAGLLVITIAESRHRTFQFSYGSRMSPADASAGLQSLGELLSSGLPLARALEALPELSPRSWESLQPSLLRSIRDGRSLAEAFRHGPVQLPRIAIGLIAAGEQSGRIAASVKHAGQLLETQNAQRTAMASALAYPAFLAVVGTTTVTMLIVFVFPRMAQLLTDLGQQIPASTQSLINLGGFIARWFVLILILFASVILGIRTLLSNRETLVRVHRALLRVPLLSGIRHSAATSRICLCMSAMIDEGLPIARALEVVDQVISDEELKLRLQNVVARVMAGESVAVAMQQSQLVTRTAVMMIAVGDRSGNLAMMFRNAAAIEAAKAERAVKLFTKFAEPALVLILGTSVMYVASALLQAVYAITPTA